MCFVPNIIHCFIITFNICAVGFGFLRKSLQTYQIECFVQDLLNSRTCFPFAEGLHMVQSQIEGYGQQKSF